MKQVFFAERAPKAIGPYSHGAASDRFLFISGQLPIDPVTDNFPEGGIEEQTMQSLLNLKAVLEVADSDLNLVLKTTVFLSDMNNFASMNEVYKRFFTENNYPARSVVEVARLPKDALVEIEAVALM